MLNPQAKAIHQLLTEQSPSKKPIINDHIALRTFNHPQMDLSTLSKVFLHLGYEERGDYHFKQKKLYAKHYEHKTNPNHPKIFISHLLLEEMPQWIQNSIQEKIENSAMDKFKEDPLMATAGRPWSMSYKEYEKMLEVSEYAAWTCAFGLRVNHFTVLINELDSFDSVSGLNSFLKGKGLVLNSSGGEVKGTEAEMLEQSSTMAAKMAIEFTDGEYTVPSCYYEFAKRYPIKAEEGSVEKRQLYQGFVAASADKIFESTDNKSVRQAS